jgi:hypothetical protein
MPHGNNREVETNEGDEGVVEDGTIPVLVASRRPPSHVSSDVGTCQGSRHVPVFATCAAPNPSPGRPHLALLLHCWETHRQADLNTRSLRIPYPVDALAPNRKEGGKMVRGDHIMKSDYFAAGDGYQCPRNAEVHMTMEREVSMTNDTGHTLQYSLDELATEF